MLDFREKFFGILFVGIVAVTALAMLWKSNYEPDPPKYTLEDRIEWLEQIVYIQKEFNNRVLTAMVMNTEQQINLKKRTQTINKLLEQMFRKNPKIPKSRSGKRSPKG